MTLFRSAWRAERGGCSPLSIRESGNVVVVSWFPVSGKVSRIGDSGLIVGSAHARNRPLVTGSHPYVC